jgi:MoaA/NifB/PqqE/SkfB family radical SAM enzyme
MNQSPADRELAIVDANLRLGRAEYFLQRTSLRSMPRILGLVLGNACNIDCPHCYQEKNGDNLLRPADIGRQLRQEFRSLYPYLSTLRIQGGEAMAYRGFRELVEDVASMTRPLLSISTNGTLIDDEWAERMVRLPFSSVTVSIDGGTPETYAKMRRGSQLELVLANVARIRKWKEKLNSLRPVLDSFFVILRSNFREIPRYLELMHENGFLDVALQTIEINHANTTREPLLVEREVIRDPHDVADLYDLMRDNLPRARKCFRMVRVSGLQTLFEKYGYDASFLQEQENGLYPDSEGLSTAPAAQTPGELPSENKFELCPNPWTTLFVAENGGVHLCFLSEPVGNLYEAPLIEIWNSPRAIVKRLRMIQGKYMASGCSENWCSWREGQAVPPVDAATAAALAHEERRESETPFPILGGDAVPSGLTAVRRTLTENNRRLAEMEQVVRTMDEEFQRMRRSILVRGAAHVARRWDRMRGLKLGG